MTPRRVLPFAAICTALLGARAENVSGPNDSAELRHGAAESANPRLRATHGALLDSKVLTSPDSRVVVAGREIRKIEGWTVLVSEDVLKDEAEATAHAIELLTAHLKEIVRVVPSAAVAHLRTVPLWISPQYPDVRPRAEYHPDIHWLRENGRNPMMAKGIEFTNVRIFEPETKRMPVFVLHELSHAYHDQVLGFDNAEIKAAYERAKASGTYGNVELERPGSAHDARARLRHDQRTGIFRRVHRGLFWPQRFLSFHAR